MNYKRVNLERVGIPNSSSVDELFNNIIKITFDVYNIQGDLLPQVFLVLKDQEAMTVIMIATKSIEEARLFYGMGYAKSAALQAEARYKTTSPTGELITYITVGHYDIRSVPSELGRKWQAGLITYEELKEHITPIDSIGFILVKKSNPEPQFRSYEIKGEPPSSKFVLSERSSESFMGPQSRSLLHLWGE